MRKISSLVLVVMVIAAGCGSDSKGAGGAAGSGGAGSGGAGAGGAGSGGAGSGGAGSGGAAGRGGAGSGGSAGAAASSGSGGAGAGGAGSGGSAGGGGAGSGGSSGGGGMGANDCERGGGMCVAVVPGACASGTVVRLSCGGGIGVQCCVGGGAGGAGGGGVGATCGGFPGTTCASTLYCDYPDDICGAADGTGTCQERGAGACPAVYSPVCGCDGRVHGNECEMRAAGADLNTLGGCTAPMGTFGCGATFCNRGTQYCQAFSGGIVAQVRYSCQQVPAGCGATPTCACLPTSGGMCTEDADHNLTVRIFAP